LAKIFEVLDNPSVKDFTENIGFSCHDNNAALMTFYDVVVIPPLPSAITFANVFSY